MAVGVCLGHLRGHGPGQLGAVCIRREGLLLRVLRLVLVGVVLGKLRVLRVWRMLGLLGMELLVLLVASRIPLWVPVVRRTCLPSVVINMLWHPWLCGTGNVLWWHVGVPVRALGLGQLGRIHRPELGRRRTGLDLVMGLRNGDG